MAHLTGHILNSNGKFRYLGEYNWQNVIGYYFYIAPDSGDRMY